MKLGLLSLILAVPIFANAQAPSSDSLDIGFSSLEASYTVKDQAAIYPIKIFNKDKDKLKGLDSLADYIVKVSVFNDSTTLPASSIALDVESLSLEAFKTKVEHKFFLTLKA